MLLFKNFLSFCYFFLDILVRSSVHLSAALIFGCRCLMYVFIVASWCPCLPNWRSVEYWCWQWCFNDVVLVVIMPNFVSLFIFVLSALSLTLLFATFRQKCYNPTTAGKSNTSRFKCHKFNLTKLTGEDT